MDIDFARTAKDYAQHRVGFPLAFFDRLEEEGLLKKESKVLDLGTGTGLLAREMAQRGAEVVGLDQAGSLLEEAIRLDKEAGVEVRYVEAAAEAMGLEEESFDLIVAGQCWHWFERPTVLRQIKNLLNPGGILVIAHFDWLPIPGSVVEATEALILKYSPAWDLGGGSGLYPHWLPDLSVEGFGGIRTESFDLEVPYSPEAWRGRIRASAGVSASLSQQRVDSFDKEMEDMLTSRYPQDPLWVPHRIWWASTKIVQSAD